MPGKEEAGFVFSKETKWPLWIPEWNPFVAVVGDRWCPLFLLKTDKRAMEGDNETPNPVGGNSRDVPTGNNVSYSRCFLKQREQAGCWVDSWSSPPSWVDPSSGLVQLIAGKAAERQKQFDLSVLPLALPLKVSVWELDNQRQNSRSSRPAESRRPWHYSSSVDLD